MRRDLRVPKQPGSSTPSTSPLAATEDEQGGGLREELLPSLHLIDILRPLPRSFSSTRDLPQTTPSFVLGLIREDLHQVFITAKPSKSWRKIMTMNVFSFKERC